MAMDEKLATKLASSPTPPNTTPPAPRPGRRSAPPAADGLGSTENGICHAYAPDGRCVSLLKILLTNFCIFDCAYCINRRSERPPRALHGDEVVDAHARLLQAQLHRGPVPLLRIIRSPTTRWSSWSSREDAPPRARLRRLHPSEDHPGCEPVARRAGGPLCRPAVDQCRAADRRRPAPPGAGEGCRLDRTRDGPDARAHRRGDAPKRRALRARRPVDADDRRRRRGERRDRLRTSASLYGDFGLRRVYYSAFSPIPDASRALPLDSRRRCCASTGSTRPTG